jgi:preprotein translocase, SecE subunit, bacterial
MAEHENMNGEMEQSESKVPAAKSAGKPAKKAKASIFARIGKWFRDLRAEAKKVIWPGRKQVVNNTIVVIVMVIVVAAFVAVFDMAFGQVRDFLAQILA